MTLNTLSHLSKGYGSWTGGYVDPYFGEKKSKTELSFPEIDPETHIHGVTVGLRSGRSTSMSWSTSRRGHDTPTNQLPLPRTYTTRRGALQIYMAPDDLSDDDQDEKEVLELQPQYAKRPHGKELIDLSLKLGTMERLAMSVLQFGDQDYDHEHTSVSDAKNKAFLKFLRSIDSAKQKEVDVNRSVQPGGDLNDYLRDLKSSSSSRNFNSYGSTHLPKSRESLELQALLRGLDNHAWPMSYGQDGASDRQSSGQFTRPVSRVSSRGASPGPPSTPRSTFQVLSAKKVAESIRSGGYLGRSGSRVSANIDDDTDNGEKGASPQHITSASVTRRNWSPTDSTDRPLLDARTTFVWDPASGENSDSEDKKRMANKEYSFASGLYPGRASSKGDSESGVEVKVTGKGEGDTGSQGKGQGAHMSQIVEENGDSGEMTRTSGSASVKVVGNDGTAKGVQKVDDAQKAATNMKDIKDNENLDSARTDVIDVEVDHKEKLTEQKEGAMNTKPKSRPNSDKSSISTSSVGSAHAPSIITLQQFKATPRPIIDERSYQTHKRKSVSQESEKSKRKNSNVRRVSTPQSEIKEHLEEIGISIAAPTPEAGLPHYSVPKYMLGANTEWNTQEAESPTEPDTPDHKDALDDKIEEEEADVKFNQMESRSESRQSKVEEAVVTKEVEQEVEEEAEGPETEIMDEEEILDNIKECNEEIMQIEAKDNSDQAYQSDSGSSVMDEEFIQAVLGSQGNLVQTDEVEGHPEDRSDKASEVKRSESRTSSRRQSLRKQSSVTVESENDLDMQSQPDDLDRSEVTEQDIVDNEVDEERMSEVRSHRSSIKGKSKRARSGAGSINGDADNDSVSAYESALPVLESDKYSNYEDQDTGSSSQPLLEDQTEFSGSTGSYSDMLASNKTSRPVSAVSSQQLSARLSRRSSTRISPANSPAASRPTSATSVKSSKSFSEGVLGSRPSSAKSGSGKLSRPASGNVSRSSSARLSRPASANISRPGSGKLSRRGSSIKSSRPGSKADLTEPNEEIISNDVDTLVNNVDDNVDILTDTEVKQELEPEIEMESKLHAKEADAGSVEPTIKSTNILEPSIEDNVEIKTNVIRNLDIVLPEMEIDPSEPSEVGKQSVKEEETDPSPNIADVVGKTESNNESDIVSKLKADLNVEPKTDEAAKKATAPRKASTSGKPASVTAATTKVQPKASVTQSQPKPPANKTTKPTPAPRTTQSQPQKPTPAAQKPTEPRTVEKRPNTLAKTDKSASTANTTHLGAKDTRVKGDVVDEKASVDVAQSEGARLAGAGVDGVGQETGGAGLICEGVGVEEEEDAHSIAQELDALGLGSKTLDKKKAKKASTRYPIVGPTRVKTGPEKMKIPEHLMEGLKRRPSQSFMKLEEDLERKGFLKDGKVTAMATEHMSGPTLEAIGEGLSEEELEMAKLLLQKKLEEAKAALAGKESPKPAKKKAPATGSKGKGAGKGKKKGKVVEELEPGEVDREALREKHELEKQIRDEEKARLQQQIAEKRALLQAQNDKSSAESKALLEKMEELEREADDLMRAEDEARAILAEVRKQKREERDAKRKADLERKKQDAQNRRDRERKELEERRKKETEMLEKIADAEVRRRAREEEERKAEEEERMAQERYEAELLENQRLQEEEEERLKELERQAEEEAMARIIDEREAAERERRRLRIIEEERMEQERIKQDAVEAEKRRLEAEAQAVEEQERAIQEQRRRNYEELKRLEEESRHKALEEVHRLRSEAIARRDYNLENLMHIDKLRNSQGITRAWTFSYFVQWPRETYERPIGEGDPRKVVKIKNPQPKKKVDPAPEGEAGEQAPAAQT